MSSYQLPAGGSLASSVQPSGGGGVLHYLFHNPVTHLAGQTIDDFINAATGSAGGLVHGGLYALTHNPVQTAEQLPHLGEAMVGQMAQDFRHPLRHPGNTLLDLLTVVPVPGAILGRAALVAKAGEMSSDLAEATRPFLASGDFQGAKAAAAALGKQDEFSRNFDMNTGAPKPAARKASEAMFLGAPREGRLLRTTPEGDAIPGWVYSRDPTIKAAQKLVDKAYTRFPDGTPPPILRVLPPFWSTQGGRISRATTAATAQAGRELAGKGQALWKRFGGVDDATHLAARMIAEGTSPQLFRDYHENILAGNNPKVKLTDRIQKETQRRLDLLPEAEQKLDLVRHDIVGENGHTYTFHLPVAKAGETELADYVDQIRNLSDARTEAFTNANILSHTSNISRTVGPLHEMLHGDVGTYADSLDKMKAQLAGIQRLHPNDPNVWEDMQNQIKQAEENPPMPFDVAEQIAQQGKLARVDYDIPLMQKLHDFATVGRRSAFRGTGRPSPPGSITHPFRAEVLRSGGGDLNTARQMALTYSEAQRYIALNRNWKALAGTLSKTPDHIPERFRQLVRDPSIKDPMTRTEADRFIARAHQENEPVRKGEADAEAMRFDFARAGMFPKKIYQAVRDAAGNIVGHAEHDTGEMAKNAAEAPYGYGWADRRLLGGLDKQNPLIPLLHNAPIARGIVRFTDALNTANKTAILYLKPAYIFPNALGNAAMNLIQQGFLTPLNLSKSVTSWRTLSPEAKQGLLANMGEGGAEALGEKVGDTASKLQAASRGIGRVYGKIVDQPFRVSSFMHEARVAGFSTRSELEHLLTDPKMHDQLVGISQRANDAIINYELLSPAEQAIMRRLVFFYPWIKGATRYTAQVYKEHPIATGLQAQGGRMEQQRTEELLGQLPSYMHGVIAGGHGLGVGRPGDVLNPNAFSILQTPAQLAEEFRNVVQGNPNPDLALSGEMSPVDRMLLDIITAGVTGQKKAAAHAALASPLSTAFQDYHGGNPIEALISRLRNQQKPSSVYQNQSWIRDLLQFGVFGNLTPRAVNVPMANYVAWKQAHPTGH